ncbi:MAG TPA: hypothetical protein VIC35_01165 [Acidimicrobiia bacterium]
MNIGPRSGSAVPKDRPITRDDLEQKFGELQGGIDSEIADARSLAITAGVVVVVVVVLIAFVLGRRRGKRLSTIVEIRRV